MNPGKVCLPFPSYFRITGWVLTQLDKIHFGASPGRRFWKEEPHLHVRESTYGLAGSFWKMTQENSSVVWMPCFGLFSQFLCMFFCCIRWGSSLNLGDPLDKGFISVEEFESHLVLVSKWSFWQWSTWNCPSAKPPLRYMFNIMECLPITCHLLTLFWRNLP